MMVPSRRTTWLLAFFLSLMPVAAQLNVATYQYDSTRAGVNSHETLLTPANVNSSGFGKIATLPSDGAVYAQPLYLSGVDMGAAGIHNVLFVASEHDTVYAYDADTVSPTPLWQKSFLNPSAGVTTIPSADTNCGHIVPEIGISSTPVIDTASGTLYVAASTLESGNFVHRLHALDVATGAEKSGSPVTIQASVAGTGDGGSTVTFDPRNYKQRIGLLLVNGVVYLGFSSHCDLNTYHGWLLGYDAHTLQQVAAFNTTPNGEAAAIWQGGAAPAADSNGNIYVVSGNGTFDGQTNFGESFLKLSGSGSLSVLDYFTPYNFADLNTQDLDVGSSGAVLLPDQPGAHPHLMIGGGKQGRIYVIDRDSLGRGPVSGDAQIVSSTQVSPLYGSGAFFNGTFYMCLGGDYLRAYPLVNGALGTPAIGKFSYDSPGCVPTISANGAANGIIWTADRSNTLRAYDASDITHELYDTTMNAARDAFGTFVKYSPPMVASGRVYAGTQNSVAVYGLLGSAAPLAVSNAASGQASVAAPGSLIAIKGTALAQAMASATGFPLPSSLGGASVTIGGIPAPLLYVSPGQINAQVPYETPAGTSNVSVANAGASTITIQNVAPGLFLLGSGRAAVVNDTGAVNSSTQPASAGSYIAAYMTGLGAVTNAVATGQPAPSAPLSQTTAGVSATIGGETAQVVFAGLAPGYAGVYQVNILVPQLAPGDYPLVISAGGVASNSGTVSVH
jgi:uncharacterized protein (TIGR03437 family)